MDGMLFADRREAGRILAGDLRHLADPVPVVLALVRGGVPVGAEIASRLGAELDLVLVRKIGVPGQPELAAAAVVEGSHPEIVLNEEVMAFMPADPAYIGKEAKRQLAEIERRRHLYLGTRSRPDPRDRTVILVDDGLATGTSALAAAHAIRRAGPRRLVLAVPVGSPSGLRRLAGEVDEIVCPLRPEFFDAVGSFYDDFHQVEDAEVFDLMSAAIPSGRQAGPG